MYGVLKIWKKMSPVSIIILSDAEILILMRYFVIDWYKRAG